LFPPNIARQSAFDREILASGGKMADEHLGDRLLVIDDEPSLRQLVKRVAEISGFEVVVTHDPAAFINSARLWRPTVIMLDLKMPGTDGIQLLRTLAAEKCAAHIVLSSGCDSRVLEAAIMATISWPSLPHAQARLLPLTATARDHGVSRESAANLFSLLVFLTHRKSASKAANCTPVSGSLRQLARVASAP